MQNEIEKVIEAHEKCVQILERLKSRARNAESERHSDNVFNNIFGYIPEARQKKRAKQTSLDRAMSTLLMDEYANRLKSLQPC